MLSSIRQPVIQKTLIILCAFIFTDQFCSPAGLTEPNRFTETAGTYQNRLGIIFQNICNTFIIAGIHMYMNNVEIAASLGKTSLKVAAYCSLPTTPSSIDSRGAFH